MRSLSAPADLLDGWEQALQVPAPVRGAVLVHRAGLTSSLDEALDLDVGRCAAAAMRVYWETFGEVAEAVVQCPACRERIEAALPTAPPASVVAGPLERAVGPWVVRTLTSRDLLAAAQSAERFGLDSAQELLLSRCVQHAPPAAAGAQGLLDAPMVQDGPGGGGQEAVADLTDLPADMLAQLDAAAEELAGAAALTSAVTCPGCGFTVEVAFDPCVMLWEQVAAAAPKVLTDVAALARAFGWSERQVFALPPERRRAYLALAGR